MRKEKRRSIMKECGISFTPKISKKSQTLERSLEDLFEWKKEKEAYTQHLIKSSIKEEKVQLNTSVKLCPGTLKILEKN